jgi:type I restriction enzyme S subunit
MNEVPTGWTKSKFEDFAVLQRGFDITQAGVVAGTVPVISSSGFSYYHNEAKVAPPGVVTGRKGKLGSVYYLDEPFWPHDTTLWVKDFKGNYPRFVATFLEFFQLERFDAATSVPTLNRNNVHSLTITYPPPSEQRKIAEILGTWEAAITTAERLVATLRERKHGLMQRLLTGEIRFPGFEGEWEERGFSEILNIEIGGTPSRANPDYWDTQKVTSNRWLSIADLKEKYITDSYEYISDVGAKKSSTRLFSEGAVVMSFKLTIGRVAILAKSCYTNEAICALMPKDVGRLAREYLYHALSVVDFEQEIDQAVKGRTLNKAKLNRLQLRLPPPQEQRKIAEFCDLMDVEIDTLCNYRAKLQLQKVVLMQRLLTGQVRVAVADDSMPASGTLGLVAG